MTLGQQGQDSGWAGSKNGKQSLSHQLPTFGD